MRNQKGFTLIELLIVVVIIGILAAIAIPKTASTKNKALLTAVKSDLKNLIVAEESYFADNLSYAPAITPNPTAGAATALLSRGNSVTFSAVTAAGWAATITNPSLTAAPDHCGLYMGGAASPNAAVTTEGVPGCW